MSDDENMDVDGVEEEQVRQPPRQPPQKQQRQGGQAEGFNHHMWDVHPDAPPKEARSWEKYYLYAYFLDITIMFIGANGGQSDQELLRTYYSNTPQHTPESVLNGLKNSPCVEF